MFEQFGLAPMLIRALGGGASQFTVNGGKPTTSVSQLQSSYAQDAGDVRLDLTKVDFASAPGTVDLAVRVNAGSVAIVLPPNLDVIVDANIQVGNADVLGQNWNGLGLSPRTVENTGADGPGGGKLHISAQIDVGNLEVSR